MERRQFVRAAGVACVAGLAGCGGDGASEPERTPGGSTPTSSGDNSDGQSSPQGSDPDDADSGNEPGSGPGGDSAASFGEAVQFEESYAMDVEYDDPETGESGTLSARFNGGDYHMDIEADGERMDLYHVDGSAYVVAQGQCSRLPGSQDGGQYAPAVDGRSGIETADEAARAHPDIQAAGTTTIDGETVYVYEIDGSRENFDRATYYVSASTGYLRRIETDYGRMDVHSWGEVGPISPPDVDCQDFGDF